MSNSSSTSISGDTISLLYLDQQRAVERALESPGSSRDTVSYNSFSKSTTSSSSQESIQRLGRRPFQRLPIPASLFIAAAYGDLEDNGVSSNFSLDVEIGYDPSIIERSTDSVPQSPTRSALSPAKQRQKSRSSNAIYAALRSGIRKGRRFRNTSEPDVVFNRQLLPSPAPSPRAGFAHEHDDLFVALKKVAKRKPIPATLFDGRNEPKPRSLSVPEIFSAVQRYNSSQDSESIQEGNSLGLYFPPAKVDAPEQHELIGDADSESAAGYRDNVGRSIFEGSLQDSAVPWPTTPRLRRATRSVSESHHNRRRVSLTAETDQEVSSSANPGSGRVRDLSGNSDPTDSSSDDSRTSRRGRTRSGSEPVHPNSRLIEEVRRYSTDQRSHILRRVSKKRQGEMRSTFLAPTSPLTHYPASAQNAITAASGHSCPSSGDNEPIEMLQTPDPDPSPSPSEGMHVANMLTASNAFDSMRSTDSSRWEWGSVGPGPRNSDASMASLMVLQQHIQMRNFQRQFAPPVADPHASPERGVRRREQREASEVEQNLRYVAESDSRRKETRVKAESMQEAESRLVRQYGAMRIKKWPSSGDEGVKEGGESMDRGESSEGENGKKVLGLRHMFSNPNLAKDEAGSLRQRRAKPPISIALSPAAQHHATGKSSSSRVSTDITAPAIPLRKRSSRTRILSPITNTSIHSPPPCPPPSTPLPQLPTPKTAPIVAAEHVTQRSFVRCSSTPVSPLDAAHPPSQQSQMQAASKSHSCNLLSALQPLAPLSTVSSGSAVSNDASGDSSMLHTPPLTGGLPAPGKLIDQKRWQQPKTPLSANSDCSVVTPVSAQPAAAVRGKFDSLLDFLSTKTRGDRADGGERGRPGVHMKASAQDEGNGVVASSNGAAQDPIVYGLAL